MEIKNLDLENEVIFLDYVNQKQLASLYKNAYALVYPCLAAPDSIAALEALYFNCPVLISDHIGYNQQLKKAALYFNPLDESDIVSKIEELNDLATKDDLINKGYTLPNNRLPMIEVVNKLKININYLEKMAKENL